MKLNGKLCFSLEGQSGALAGWCSHLSASWPIPNPKKLTVMELWDNTFEYEWIHLVMPINYVLWPVVLDTRARFFFVTPGRESFWLFWHFFVHSRRDQMTFDVWIYIRLYFHGITEIRNLKTCTTFRIETKEYWNYDMNKNEITILKLCFLK